MFCAIIVAAGNSRRAGFDKLLAPLAGQAVLKRSIAAFMQAGAQEIIVVCPQSRWDELELEYFAHQGASAKGAQAKGMCARLHRVDGGAQRQDSVFAGIQALPSSCDYVAVHDGARPLILPEDILSCLAVAQNTGAAACAHPIVDTLKRSDAEGRSLPESINREQMWGMETPQIFEKSLLQQAYQSVLAEKAIVTDEVSVMEYVGKATSLVSGSVNLKITLPGDLELAELIWQQRESRR